MEKGDPKNELVTILAIVIVISLIIIIAAFIALNANASINGNSFFDVLKDLFVSPQEKVVDENPVKGTGELENTRNPDNPLPPKLPPERLADPGKPLVT